jgi:hypothetical protein
MPLVVVPEKAQILLFRIDRADGKFLPPKRQGRRFCDTELSARAAKEQSTKGEEKKQVLYP